MLKNMAKSICETIKFCGRQVLVLWACRFFLNSVKLIYLISVVAMIDIPVTLHENLQKVYYICIIFSCAKTYS